MKHIERYVVVCSASKPASLLAIMFCCGIFLPVAGCNPSSDLNREAAAAILNQYSYEDETKVISASVVEASGGFQEPIDNDVAELKKYVLGTDAESREIQQKYNAPGMSNMYMRINVEKLSAWRNLAKQGFLGNVIFHKKPTGTPSVVIVSATPLIAEALHSQCNKADLRMEMGGFSCTVKVASRRFAGVSGIFGGPNEKTVEYQVQYEPTEIGSRMGIHSNIEKRMALFRKYDDGWRIAR